MTSNMAGMIISLFKIYHKMTIKWLNTVTTPWLLRICRLKMCESLVRPTQPPQRQLFKHFIHKLECFKKIAHLHSEKQSYYFTARTSFFEFVPRKISPARILKYRSEK